jgi:hypothetical protein
MTDDLAAEIRNAIDAGAEKVATAIDRASQRAAVTATVAPRWAGAHIDAARCAETLSELLRGEIAEGLSRAVLNDLRRAAEILRSI